MSGSTSGTPNLRGWAFLFLAPFATVAAGPDPAAALVATARAQELHAELTWRRLLYVRDGASEVISPEFFLAPEGARDPAAELEATLAAWFDERVGDGSPRCRFPARYLWLGRRLQLPPRPDPACTSFDRWADLQELDSISALMVSGYLGNPASSFGHSLFKLNRRGPKGESVRLLDTSYSFGALVPRDENVFLYVMRGLTGAYDAGFSDKLYYARDQVYTRTQFRDIWEYRLALDAEQRRFLVSHLWEMLGIKYTYWFLTRNCGFRMAELVALVTERDLAPEPIAWYAPAELFHDLMGPVGGDGVHIASIDFIPSAQRVMQHRFAELDDAQRAAANRVIASDGAELGPAMAALAAADRRRALDVLVAYYEYRLASQEESARPELKALKDRVLLARLALPISTEPLTEVPVLPPVSARHPPLAVEVGLRTTPVEARGVLRGTAYLQDLADDPASGSELAVAELELDFDRSGDLAVDHFDLIRVRRLQTAAAEIHGESRRSWQVRVGWRRGTLDDLDARAEIAGAVGRAASTGEATLVYGMLGVVLRDGTNTDPQALGTLLEPSAGVVHRSGPASVEIELADRVDLRRGGWEPRGRLVAQWRSKDRRSELRGGYERVDGTEALFVGVVRYW